MTDLISDTEKRRIISEIDDEVNKFHPLLEAIFKKMPRMGNVWNTHGPNERGADFILELTDDTTLEVDYIAVVVKIGKIDKNIKSNGVSDQINESIKRYRHLPGGKKIDDVSEVWVITNEAISHNAREAIHDEYKKTKIKFFELANIVKWVDSFLKDYWMRMPVELGDYLRAENIKVCDQERSLSLVGGMDAECYIEQGIRPIRPAYESKRKKLMREYSSGNIHDFIGRNTIILIEGEAGYGKSKLLRHLTKHYCVPSNYLKCKIIPIYLNFADLDFTDDKAISRIVNDRIKTKVAEAQLNSHTILILLDGFDEKRLDERERILRLSSLRSQIAEFSNCKLVITSRPLNISEKHTDLKQGIGWYELMPLSMKGMINFFAVLCKKESISGRIVEDIKKSSLFKQLPKSPIAAILLARLLEERSRDLPSNLTELYKKYTELMLGRWDMSKNLQSEREFEASSSIIKNIAVYFLENNLTFLSLEEAKGFFSKYLSERNLGIKPDALFSSITQRSGILMLDETNGRVCFKHKTFAEFFYAAYQVSERGINFIDKRIYNPFYKNIYFFFVGLQKDCEKVLNEMLEVSPKNDPERFLRPIFMADYFLAGYATPYQFIKNKFALMIREVATLYVKAIEGKAGSPFKEMPELMILWFFQSFVRNCYGYDFFRAALQDVALEVMTDGTLTNSEKAYGAFFVSVIGVELKEPNPFDGLIDTLEAGLPLSVQFGIHYEAENVKVHSRILNRQERKLNRFLTPRDSKDRGIKNILVTLHEVPIEEVILRREKNIAKRLVGTSKFREMDGPS